MAQLNISIPSALKAWIGPRVAEGRYSSASDFVRDLVRRDQDKAPDESAGLQQMLDEGEASGVSDRDPYQVIEDIIAEGRAKSAAA